MYINFFKKYLLIKQNYTKISLDFFIIIIFILNVFGCANIQAPNGGPRDTIPPSISDVSPPNFQNNFSLDKYSEITISFDKYMDKGKVVENIFISPDTKLKFNWSGKKLEIRLIDTLLPQTTYTLNLGTEYTDFLGNKPQESFTYVFSTGEKIDKGIIKGQVFDKSMNKNDKNTSNLYVFAYKINDNLNDTNNKKLNIINQLDKIIDKNNVNKKESSDSIFIKPDYQTQVGKDGNFTFNGLKAGKYIITAIDDKYKDRKFDLGIDRIGLSNDIIEISDSVQFTTNIKLGNIIDITPPILNSSELISKNRISINFSEGIYSQNMSKYSILITDSTMDMIFFPMYLIPNLQKANKIDVIFSKNLDTSKIWKTIILNTKNLDQFFELTKKTNIQKELINEKIIIRDTSSNLFNDSINYTLFKPENKINEEFQVPTIIISNGDEQSSSNFELKDSSEIKDLNFSFILKSNYSLSDSISNFINFTQNDKNEKSDKKNLKLIVEKKAENILYFYTEKKLELNSKYTISYDSKNLLKEENLILNDIKIKDTTITINFNTPKTNKLSFLSGKFVRNKVQNIIEKEDLSNLNVNYILTFTNETSNKEYFTYVKNNGNFKIENLESGNYSIEIIEDKNNNNIYDGGYFDVYGNLIFSEKFVIYKDKVKIKQNWDMEDFILKLDL